MKRILIAVGIVAIILVACRWPGTHGVVSPPPPGPQPNAAGCSCTITAMGTALVDSMSWSNPVTGHIGSGGQVIHPELGSICAIFTDASINCKSNSPNIAFVTFICHGTNIPYAIPITLPVNCNGVEGTVSGDCDKCRFSAIFTNGWWCNIYAPRK